MAETCQESLRRFEVKGDGGNDPWLPATVTVMCGKPASLYRQCAAGCKIIIAYCEEHGGDERAVREMVLHHSIVHNQGPSGNHP